MKGYLTMAAKYSEIIAEIQKLATEEKKEVKSLIERYILEDEREQIYANYQESLKELKEGTLQFTSNMNELKGSVNND